MGLFSKKEKKAEVAPVAPTRAPQQVETKLVLGRDIARVILRPRVTEKAALAIDRNVYTFEIHRDADKYAVADAIRALYKVTPIKVHIVNKKPRHSMARGRGRKIMHAGLKKAYVYLKKDDRIDLT